jgi:Zinc knuckle./Retrotransposon gag protein.
MSRATSPVRATTEQLLQQILAKFNTMETRLEILTSENAERVKEIVTMGKRLGMQPEVGYATEDDGNLLTEEEQETNSRRNHRSRIGNENQNMEPRMLNRPFVETRAGFNQVQVAEQLIPAKDIIRTIKAINGQDDIGIEDFIKTIRKARLQCNQPNLLLDFIIAEKITGNAEKAIRYTQIDSYEDLYETLRRNLTQVGSVSSLRSRLESCKQGLTETVQNFNVRFRQLVNELKYAVQAEHSGPMERRIAIGIEEKESLKRYMLNLKREIGLQVRAQKPITLGEAQNYAIEMELWLKEAQPIVPQRNSIQKPIIRSTFIKPSINTQPTMKTQSPNVNLTDRNKITCYKCGKVGHLSGQCTLRPSNFPVGQFPKRPPQIRNIQTEEDQMEAMDMTREEIEEQTNYENSAEFLPLMDCCNPSEEQKETDENTVCY